MGVEFVKGHGTENDFVLLPDTPGRLELTPERVRALCDRHRGLGADGVLRMVRASDVDDAPSTVDPDLWFMDYRNANGSVAEMCGNGLRVFARYLVDSGLAQLGEFAVGTRSGLRMVTVHPDRSVTVDMGPARIFGESTATVSGQTFPGVVVDVGNPHLACVVDLPVADVDLSVPPGHDATVFPHGVNVEFVNLGQSGSLLMRVHERGVGETRACGTGTVAAVVAALREGGATEGRMEVTAPGGRVQVTVDKHTSTLTGPAVLLARGELDKAWWESVGESA